MGGIFSALLTPSAPSPQLNPRRYSPAPESLLQGSVSVGGGWVLAGVARGLLCPDCIAAVPLAPPPRAFLPVPAFLLFLIMISPWQADIFDRLSTSGGAWLP